MSNLRERIEQNPELDLRNEKNIDESITDDAQLMAKCCAAYMYNFQVISKRLSSDKDFLMSVLNSMSDKDFCYQFFCILDDYMEAKFRYDEDVATFVCKKTVLGYTSYIADCLKMKKKYARIALRNGAKYKDLAGLFDSDPEFAASYARENFKLYATFSPEIRNNPDVAIAAVEGYVDKVMPQIGYDEYNIERCYVFPPKGNFFDIMSQEVKENDAVKAAVYDGYKKIKKFMYNEGLNKYEYQLKDVLKGLIDIDVEMQYDFDSIDRSYDYFERLRWLLYKNMGS